MRKRKLFPAGSQESRVGCSLKTEYTLVAQLLSMRGAADGHVCMLSRFAGVSEAFSRAGTRRRNPERSRRICVEPFCGRERRRKPKREPRRRNPERSRGICREPLEASPKTMRSRQTHLPPRLRPPRCKSSSQNKVYGLASIRKQSVNT